MAISAYFLSSRATVYRNTLDVPNPDSIGGYTRTMTSAITAVPCSVQWDNGKEEIAFGKAQVRATHRIYFNANLKGQLLSTDVLAVTMDKQLTYFEILLVDDSCLWRDHIRVYARATRAPTVFTPESSSSYSSESSESSSTFSSLTSIT